MIEMIIGISQNRRRDTGLIRLVGLSKISLIGSIVVVVLCSTMLINFTYWSVSTYSFDLGYQTASTEFEADLGLPKLSFSPPGRLYQDLTEGYTHLALLAAGCLGIGVLRIFEKMREIRTTLSFFNAIFLLAIIWLLWFYQIGLKGVNDPYADAPYRVLLAPSLTFDWICLFLTVALILIEMTLFFAWVTQRRMLKD